MLCARKGRRKGAGSCLSRAAHHVMPAGLDVRQPRAAFMRENTLDMLGASNAAVYVGGVRNAAHFYAHVDARLACAWVCIVSCVTSCGRCARFSLIHCAAHVLHLLCVCCCSLLAFRSPCKLYTVNGMVWSYFPYII